MEGDTFCGEGHILLEEVGRFQQLENKFYERNLFLAIKNWLLGKDFMLCLFLTSCIEGVKVLNKLTRWCWILTLVDANIRNLKCYLQH